MSYESEHLALAPLSYWRMQVPDAESGGGGDLLNVDDPGISKSTFEASARGLWFKPDGSSLFIAQGFNNSVIEYTMSPAGDITSASAGSSVGVADDAAGLFFKADGASFYFPSNDDDDVKQYDMSTPWDLTTASLAGTFSVAGQTSEPNGVYFSDDGTRMYVIRGGGGGRVYQYDLSVAWDVTSAIYNSVSLDVDLFGGDDYEDLGFNDDGTKLYTWDRGARRVRRWGLTTAWDLGTASYDTGQLFDPVISNIYGMFVDVPGSKFWLLTDPAGGAVIHEFHFIGALLFDDIGSLANDGEQSGDLDAAQGLVRLDSDGAAGFAGAGQVEIPHDAAYSINTTGLLSVELLIDLGVDASATQYLAGKGGGAGAGAREWEVVVLNGDTLQATAFKDDGAVLQRSDIPIAAGRHHVGIDFTGVTNNDDIGITLDGTAQTPNVSNGTSGTIATGTADVMLGASASGGGGQRLQDSVLDEVLTYGANPTEADYSEFATLAGIHFVAAAHTAVWSLRLAAAHTASIPLRVRATHTAVIRESVRRAHTAPVVFLAPVRAAHRALWDLREFVPVRAAHTASIPLRVRAAHKAPVPLMAFIRRAHRALWDLRVDVRAAHKATVPLLDHDPVRAAHRAVFSLLSAPRTHLSMNVSLTVGERTIPVLRWDLRHDEGGYLWEGEVDVDAGGYAMVRVDDPVTLDLFGEAYALVIESRRRDKRGPTGRRFVLGVRSPTVRFDFPRADPVTRTFDESVMARAAVEALLGEALTWELVDWRIPAFRLAFEEASPIAAAQQIVEAAGGTIQTDPDGTLRARHLYPVSPKKLYADAAAARVIDDQDDVTASSESFEPRRLVDRLTIRDTVEGLFSDRIEFVPDEDDDRAGTVHVYPSPWRTNLVVTHTSNASLQLTPLGETTREETEIVEFTAGTARLRFPIDALLAVDWLYDSLGGVSFEPYATELQAAQDEGWSLAEIRYQTRSIDYRLASPTVDQAQLLLQEVA